MRELRKADVVFPISEFSGRELREFWGAEGKTLSSKVRTHVLPGEFRDVPRVTEFYEEAGGIRVLSVGSIEPRKNHLGMFAAFERLCLEYPSLDIQLSLAGNISREIYGMVYQVTRRNPRVRYLGYADDGTLRESYRKAHFTVFPSVSEGFGLPILESLWYGKPCICADFGAMAEVGTGGGCLMVDTRFAAEIYTAMKRLAFDDVLRGRLGREAVDRPMKSWNDYAAEIADALEVSREGVHLG
jgi:glycosyltransferase involved in cell wall biosynthesis